MRVVMFGFQTWGFRTLQALIDLDHEVVLAVTHPASEQSYKAILSESVEQLARDSTASRCISPSGSTPRQSNWSSARNPMSSSSTAGTRWMPPELYNLPPHGTLNLHDSLLPKFTGFSPVLWALISGESEFGLTVHRMDDGPGHRRHPDPAFAAHQAHRYRHRTGAAGHGPDSRRAAGRVDCAGVWDRGLAAAEQGRTDVLPQALASATV